MPRNKSKDDNYFNCSQEHELDYVSGLYPDKQKVYNFLIQKCKDNTIHYSTHMEIYKLIRNQLGYLIPV